MYTLGSSTISLHQLFTLHTDQDAHTKRHTLKFNSVITLYLVVGLGLIVLLPVVGFQDFRLIVFLPFI